MNTREADCTDLHDVLFGMLGADGTFERAPVDGLGRSFEVHPATGKRFDEVRIPGARDAFDLCLRAALEVPQVRYVGWDVAFSRRGSILMEGNAYPSYHLLQFNKLTGRTTGHLKDVADVLGDEMRDIKLSAWPGIDRSAASYRDVAARTGSRRGAQWVRMRRTVGLLASQNCIICSKSFQIMQGMKTAKEGIARIGTLAR